MENPQNTKTIPNRLFVLKSPFDIVRNQYDIVINDGIRDGKIIVPDDKELCIRLYDKIYMNNDPGFDLSECLDYHFTHSDNKEYFLRYVKEALIMQHSDWPSNAYEEYRHKQALEWFANNITNAHLNTSVEDAPEKLSHRILLLYELGIVDFLSKEYFNSQQNDRNSTDFAKIIAVIINEDDKVETIRKAISGMNTGNKSDIVTSTATKKVGTFLSNFNIKLKRLKRSNY
ncbi:hypothetical protein [Mucilaginibacter polytrichastri]|uniref:Uncharacterized protein n=1 Tax=Mucilaginibacter polytrichastri TaxID=1302689 RepID=A0A1Q5ZT46_9SPHI|nr:hypothetical protein [Mucilaginibacter polytrichastri]OKS84913.1 hypothetical protein RG47T_0351 [Mucilaginibacter polytrichastri]SFS47742.1 hypothetical protein SAMN04487890_101723 [Mucilaginibacter polytrichastri]